MRVASILSCSLLFAACDPYVAPIETPVIPGDPIPDTATPDDTDPAATPTPQPDTDVPEDTDLPEDTDASVPVVRFVVLGDAGEGNADQYAVAGAMETVCAANGCDFALYLGDNFYDDGVHSATDSQFDSKFELPYANIDFPFYVVLGNHDYGEIPLQFWRTEYQVDYTAVSTKWTMPDTYYTFDAGHATFLGLDTNSLMLNLSGAPAQKTWVRNTLRTSQSTWKIAYGHHPFKSNGRHGNAGNYEGAFYDITGLVRGAFIQDFFQDELCRKADLYLSGHDHNRQWLSPSCGMEIIVSGAGSKTTDFENRDNNPTLFEDDATEGFVWIQLEGRTMDVVFYDKFGNVSYSGSVTK